MKSLEKKLAGLFDFQRFAGSERLGRLIRETEARRAAAELSDDELAWVSAAGDPGLRRDRTINGRTDGDD